MNDCKLGFSQNSIEMDKNRRLPSRAKPPSLSQPLGADQDLAASFRGRPGRAWTAAKQMKYLFYKIPYHFF